MFWLFLTVCVLVFGFMYEMDAKRSHELVLKDKETVIYNEKTGEMKKI